ncbi:hypothetical protein AWB71_05845 [Caballeronia peredens]|nr:hypothetical protein AWB71_05845 [Caballeronia peredens]
MPAQFPPLPEYLAPSVQPDTSSADMPMSADAALVAGVLGPVVTQFRTLRCGCWLLSYRPTGSSQVVYDGTLRVECHRAGRTASGDLYQRNVRIFPLPPAFPDQGDNVLAPVRPLLSNAPKPANGIPVLPRSRYRYYIRVTSMPELIYRGNAFTLGFELWRYTAPNAWALESTLSARMVHMAAPTGYPSASDYAEGDVKNAQGTVTGRLKMGWLSSYFRKCTVEIDTVNGSEQPTTSGVGHTWQTVMDTLGWQVNLRLSDTNVTEPSGASWSDAEMHAAMLAYREATNLDNEWRYHILAVKNIDSTPRGIMYDVAGTDSNNVPREGIGIASHWTIDPGWGTVSGMRFGTASAPYFRTAIHEVGHAMGLVHNFADHGYMCTSDVIAQAGTATNPFPANIQWSYHADNLKQLRHYPDPFVRPGAVAFGGASSTSPAITPTDLETDVEGLALEVTPLLGEVPIGAPVRVDIALVNQGSVPLRVPADLSIKGEFVCGQVVDPSGSARSFRTVVRCIEDHAFTLLNPGESIRNSMTLMRGAEGALFPMPGVHGIEVEVHWDTEEMIARVAGHATVMVTGAMDAQHAAAAHAVLATPDAHLVLAIGGDHLTDGIAAIHKALACPVLAPHFAAIEAKRVGRRFGSRKPDVKAAAAMIDADSVMSGAEVGKLAEIAGSDAKANASTKGLSKVLKSKARSLTLSSAASKAVDEL